MGEAARFRMHGKDPTKERYPPFAGKRSLFRARQASDRPLAGVVFSDNLIMV